MILFELEKWKRSISKINKKRSLLYFSFSTPHCLQKNKHKSKQIDDIIERPMDHHTRLLNSLSLSTYIIDIMLKKRVCLWEIMRIRDATC